MPLLIKLNDSLLAVCECRLFHEVVCVDSKNKFLAQQNEVPS